jgi:hypothetical protein
MQNRSVMVAVYGTPMRYHPVNSNINVLQCGFYDFTDGYLKLEETIWETPGTEVRIILKFILK